MRVLWLIQSYEVHAFDLLAEALSFFVEIELATLDSNDQDNLKLTFSNFDFGKYDIVMTTLRTKKEMRQWRVMATIPNLVIFEYDACQNYMKNSKYSGHFSRYYKQLGGPRIIVSGAEVAKKLRAEGFDAHFLPKGYDSRIIDNQETLRDIPLAFVGRLNRPVYAQRKAMINFCQQEYGLQILETQSSKDYATLLSRIKIFLSADIGLGEYMAKNFEAMAAGCLLFTYSQGDTENEALGFKDMHNVVLYHDKADLDKKMALLRENDLLVKKIALEGSILARNVFAYDKMGDRLAKILQEPLMMRVIQKNWLHKLLRKFHV